MIIIGERLNATKKAVGEALRARDADFVHREAAAQTEAGAHYLDCNAGRDPQTERETMQWLVRTAREATDLPFSIDSANPEVLAAGLEAYEGPPPILNSATAESAKMGHVLDLAAQGGAGVICLCIGDGGMPKQAGDREAYADTLIAAAQEWGIDPERIFVDPVVEAVSASLEEPVGRHLLTAIRTIREQHPDVHVVAGVSNVSYGLPNRKLLNRTLLALGIGAGLDVAIIDPCDPHMIAALLAAEALVGLDENCMNYVMGSREGRLEV